MKFTLKPSRLLLAVTTLVVALLFTFAITTTVLGKDKPPKPPPDNNSNDTRVLIQSVDPASQTVVFQVMKDNSTHPYKIDAGTSITVNNNPGTFADIKPGMEVISSTERDSSTLDAISVGVASPPPDEPKGKGKKNNNNN